MGALVHWYAGWSLVVAGFVSGAAMGFGFHRDEFLGAYGSLRRRLLRLGHVALVALGMFNVLFSLLPQTTHVSSPLMHAASVGWLGGGVAMPLVCFLAAWKPALRPAFVVPVILLLLAAVLTAAGGRP
ncbi:MAG TPA: hypothetical protein VFB96_13800 [Pirellulaceae bacterium]|jgi:hypothetical protein|nr:hypothetical protein [Pirellulaceae bacterium]